jgi:hypothetical protein
MTSAREFALEFQAKLLSAAMQQHIPDQEQASCSQDAVSAYMAQKLQEPSRGRHALEAVLARHQGLGEQVIQMHLERMRCRPGLFDSCVCSVGTPGCRVQHPSATVVQLMTATAILSRTVPEPCQSFWE